VRCPVIKAASTALGSGEEKKQPPFEDTATPSAAFWRDYYTNLSQFQDATWPLESVTCVVTFNLHL